MQRKHKRTDNEPGNVSPLQVLSSQTFGREDETSDHLTPQVGNTKVRKERDSPQWRASRTLVGKEKPLIRSAKNTPDLSPDGFADSDPEYIPESTSEEVSITEIAPNDRSKLKHIKSGGL